MLRVLPNIFDFLHDFLKQIIISEKSLIEYDNLMHALHSRDYVSWFHYSFSYHANCPCCERPRNYIVRFCSRFQFPVSTNNRSINLCICAIIVTEYDIEIWILTFKYPFQQISAGGWTEQFKSVRNMIAPEIGARGHTPNEIVEAIQDLRKSFLNEQCLITAITALPTWNIIERAPTLKSTFGLFCC